MDEEERDNDRNYRRNRRRRVLILVCPDGANVLSEEAKDVGVFGHLLLEGLARAVTGLGLHTNHDWVLGWRLHVGAAHDALDLRNVFEGVEGHHAIVVIRSGEHERRVGGAHSVQGRVRMKVLEVLRGCLCVAVI